MISVKMLKNHKREKGKEIKSLEDKIIKLREEGKRIREIAKELCISYGKVWRTIHGIDSANNYNSNSNKRNNGKRSQEDCMLKH